MGVIAKVIRHHFFQRSLPVIIGLAAIVLGAAGILSAEPPVEILTPPGLIRVDGLDTEADQKVRSLLLNAPEVEYLAFFSESKAWEEFLAGKAQTFLPSLFAYIAIMEPLKKKVLSPKEFEEVKEPVLEMVEAGMFELLANEPRYITTLMKMYTNKPDLPQPSTLLTSIMMIDGRCFSLYTINYGGPELEELFRSSHMGWRDAYVNKTGPGHSGGKTDSI